uniref:GRF-type domain-containing protein n=1 Tax=Chenopodium quinoa TaxID=63459 RepID=A0A803N0M7_CHEQI
MASHLSVGSGSSRSRSKGNSSSPAKLVCYHNELAPLRTVRYDGSTKGKRFYGCSYWPEKRTCGFFKWADEVNDLRELQNIVVEKEETISELEHQVQMLKQDMDLMRDKVKKLKAKKEKLVEEVEEMGISTTETMFELKENNTDKRLMITLVFSWAFFTLVLMFK